MFYKTLITLPLLRLNFQHSYRICLCRKLITSSYCYAKETEKLMISDIKRLQTLLQCTTEKANEVYQVLKSSRDQQNDFIECKNIVKWLNENGATIASIRDNCHLLQRTFDSIKERFKLLKQMGWKTTDDFLPLLILTKDEIIKAMANEPYRIRIQVYNFAQKCSMEPQKISKYLAKGPFIFFIGRDLLDQKLEIILSGNINPGALLKELGIFRYGADRIKSRIAFLSESEVDCILPWMIKEPENIIKRYLQRRKKNYLKEMVDKSANGGQIGFSEEFEPIECDFSESSATEISGISRSKSVIDQKIVTKVEKLFECSTSKAIELYISLNRPHLDELKFFEKKLKWLKSNDVSTFVVIDNCKMLLQPLDKIEENFILLKALNWQAIDDFIPLLTQAKTRIINRGHIFRSRIYEIADEISMEAHHVAKYCIKHPFIFTQKFDALKPKIELLIKYDVMPDNILRDLTALVTDDDTIKLRLEILSMNYIKHIMPWTLRCDEDKFERFIAFRKSKGPQWNYAHDTLMRKLMLHANTARSLMNKNKFLSTHDSESLNSILDLLLRHFSTQKIIENIHILDKSMAKLNHRITELQSLNAQTLNEIFFTKTDDEFNTFVKIAKREKTNSKE